MSSSFGKRDMNAPSMRSGVAATAMPRMRGACSAKNFSRSPSFGKRIKLNLASSPITMTGLGGPISTTSIFSAAIRQSSQQIRISHQHRDGLLDERLERRNELGAERAIDHAVI